MMKLNKSDANLLRSIVDVVAFVIIAVYHVIVAIYLYFLPKSYHKKKSIQGEIALVTGGGGGLGRLLALRLSQLGCTVVLWDINKEGVEETVSLVKGIGGKAYGYTCDIADKEDVYRVAKKTQIEVGDVTILINNAGVASCLLLLDTPDHLIKRTFDVNIIAHFWTVKAFLPRMIEKNHGHIVTVASMAGHVGISKLVDYCASKHAAVGFDEALRVELEAQGIKGVKTTCICPYFIQSTGMFSDVAPRFLQRLKSNDVADRTIEAIVKNDTCVLIPAVFYVGLVLKSMVPWTATSLFLRALVPDASSHSSAPSQQIETVKSTEDVLVSNNKVQLKNVNNLSDTVTQINQAMTAVGKNL